MSINHGPLNWNSELAAWMALLDSNSGLTANNIVISRSTMRDMFGLMDAPDSDTRMSYIYVGADQTEQFYDEP